MELLQCILTGNDCYKTGQTIRPRGVMVHSTGANNPTIRRYVQPLESTPNWKGLLETLGTNRNRNDWNRSGTNACVHGFIGKLADGTVAAAQTLPWDHRGWHAGTGTSGRSANDTHISFEICEDDLTDPVYFGQVYEAAVELTAMLCKRYGLDPLADGVVICHSEGYRRGIASGHADVEHWFPRFGKSMDDFRRDVAELLRPPEPEQPAQPAQPEQPGEEAEQVVRYEKLSDVPESYRPTIAKLVERGALKGRDGGPDPVLDLSEDTCRVLTILDRMGKLD